ncbi:MAG: methyltransferase domain-containing protein [Acidobacteriota bacterium]|nr:MAG: methyltransferase domain-containing protein [Acidobacteriota bacterium]
MFEKRSEKLERIDTGDYTAEEYDRFLEDIRKVNRYAGDSRALRNSLINTLKASDTDRFRILDIGAGSGELLREIARYSRKAEKKAHLAGLEINERSARSILEESKAYPEIRAVRGDALRLPFRDRAFDYVISSLFAHHLTDRQIVMALKEMGRVAGREIFLIDLHRHPAAFAAYKVFCSVFGISQLVRQDGSLSVLRGFKPPELLDLAKEAGFDDARIVRSFPFRLILRINLRQTDQNLSAQAFPDELRRTGQRAA